MRVSKVWDHIYGPTNKALQIPKLQIHFRAEETDQKETKLGDFHTFQHFSDGLGGTNHPSLGGSQWGWCRWGRTKLTPFFCFLRFSSLFFVLLRFSITLLEDKSKQNIIYCKNVEFHSDPVCTDPVQNFPTRDELGPLPGTNRTEWRFYCGIKQKTAGDGSQFVSGRGPVCPRDGSCLSQGPSRPKCLCLMFFFLPESRTQGCPHRNACLKPFLSKRGFTQ